jgi:hypothetical protein
MIEASFPLTNYEQNEGNEQTPTGGCKDQPSVGISSFASFCSSFVGKKPTADLLQEWRRGLDRMRGHPPPAGWAERSWRQFKLDAFALLAEHGSHAAALDWRTEELFGVHREHATARVAASGLARFIHGGSVEITHELARSPPVGRRPDLSPHRTTARRRAGLGTLSSRRR